MSSESREEFLHEKMQSNWRRVKDRLVNEHKLIQEFLFEVKIINIEDVQKVGAIQTDLEKIDYLLKRVLVRNKCIQLFDFLEENGYETLCKQITETDSKSFSRNKTPINDENSLKEDQESDKFNDLKQFFIARDKERECLLEKRLEVVEQKMVEKEQEWAQQDNAREERYKTLFAKMDERYSELVLQKTMYADLQKSYKASRERIIEMTERAKEKQRDNVKQEKCIQQLQEQLKGSDSVAQYSTNIKEEKAKLEGDFDDLMKEMETMLLDKGELEELINIKDKIIRKLEERVETLTKANLNLKMIQSKLKEKNQQKPWKS